jgi:outer membrane protein assembly factor BamB
MRGVRIRLLALGAALLLLLLGGGYGFGPGSAAGQAAHRPPGNGPHPRLPTPDGDWPTFGYDAQRDDVGPARTGINKGNLGLLKARVVELDGTVDSSPIQLHAVRVNGRVLDVVVVTTAYGKTIAIDPATGAKLWEFTPSDIAGYQGTGQITESSPVADPDRQYVYAASPDGEIHKLAVANGHQVWQAEVTLAPIQEKISSALNIAGGSVLVVTGSYFDNPPYDGHVALIDRKTGAVTAVWNAMCSNIRRLIASEMCPDATDQTDYQGDDSIWGRSGGVVEPSGRILVATANGRFNGSTDWGDSVLELSPTLSLVHNWTPSDQQELQKNDWDLGSTSPGLLPEVHHLHLALQGGKGSSLALLNLDRLDGTDGPAGPRLGGELQDISTPGHSGIFGQPALWQHQGHDYVFVSAQDSAAYELVARPRPRLRLLWQTSVDAFTSVLAGGLVYVYNPVAGTLYVLAPLTGSVLLTLPAAVGHWNTPIVVGGRIILPVGSANDYLSTGKLYIYHLPGR